MTKIENKIVRFYNKITLAMDDSEEHYSGGDYDKIGACITLVVLFFQHADRARASGKRVNARMIVENLRCYGDVGDDSTEYKIKNQVIALMAHVYNDIIGSKYFRTAPRTPFEDKAA